MVTVYDIQYAYYPNGVRYTGELVGSQIAYTIGDRFDIKYDPDVPENSTTILQPSPGALAINPGMAGVFACIGLWGTGILSTLRKRRYPDPMDSIDAV